MTTFLVIIDTKSPLYPRLPEVIARLGRKSFHRLPLPEIKKFTSQLLAKLPDVEILFIPNSLQSPFPHLREIKPNVYGRRAYLAVPKSYQPPKEVTALIGSFLTPSELELARQVSKGYQQGMELALSRLTLPYRKKWEELVTTYGSLVGPFTDFFQPTVPVETMEEVYREYLRIMTTPAFKYLTVGETPDSETNPSANWKLLTQYLPIGRIAKLFERLDILPVDINSLTNPYTTAFRLPFLQGVAPRLTPRDIPIYYRLFGVDYLLQAVIRIGRIDLLTAILQLPTFSRIGHRRIYSDAEATRGLLEWNATHPEERETLLRMITLLKSAGWQFLSHSLGDFTESDISTIQQLSSK